MGLIIKFFLSGFREEFTQPFSKSVGRTILTEGSLLDGAMQAVPGRLLGLRGSILPSRETGLGNISVRITLTLEFEVGYWY